MTCGERTDNFTMTCGEGTDSFTMICGKGSDIFTMTCGDPSAEILTLHSMSGNTDPLHT